jgi:Spy/CpxP family protein refolding chaperone
LLVIKAGGRRGAQTPGIEMHGSPNVRSWSMIAALGVALGLSACAYRGGMGPGPGGGYGMMHGGNSGMMYGGCGAMTGGGQGPGMMAGDGCGFWRDVDRLDLTPDQRAGVAQVRTELQRQHEATMRAMHADGGPHRGWQDEAAQRQQYEQMSALHKAMFESQLAARRRVLELLTPAQRDQLGQGGAGR